MRSILPSSTSFITSRQSPSYILFSASIGWLPLDDGCPWPVATCVPRCAVAWFAYGTCYWTDGMGIGGKGALSLSGKGTAWIGWSQRGRSSLARPGRTERSCLIGSSAPGLPAKSHGSRAALHLSRGWGCPAPAYGLAGETGIESAGSADRTSMNRVHKGRSCGKRRCETRRSSSRPIGRGS